MKTNLNEKDGLDLEDDLALTNGVDFSKMKVAKNPYYEKVTSPVNIRLSDETIAYFTKLAKEEGTSYENLIELYLGHLAYKGTKFKIGGAAK